MYKRFFKRPIDFALALAIIVALSPIYVVLSILIKIKMGSPVIFSQTRPGLNEKPFNIYKFRSMTQKRGKDGNLLPDRERITTLGKFLRKTSLDEIPQFFNVLKGDMSFIGPRPLLTQYLPYYTQEEKLRHSVRPGVTGLAQAKGRNTISWDSKLALDVEYVKTLSFFNDVKIALLTIGKVLARSEVIAVPVEKYLDDERRRETAESKTDSKTR
ncbi:MAG: sugar transferase [Verrucomicrobia bacterium]|nr:MAG: sugar transferase [Verrucomicrobiota bacterium]